MVLVLFDILLALDLTWSHSCAGVMVTIMVSMAVSSGMEPMCRFGMAPVRSPSGSSLVVRIFSKAFLKQERKEIDLRFIGSLK